MSFNVLAELRSEIQKELNIPCYVEVPKDRPEQFITIERTGGSSNLGVDRPIIAVQTWAESASSVYDLTIETNKALLNLAETIPSVCKADVTSFYNFPDPDSKMKRYQLNLELVTRL